MEELGELLARLQLTLVSVKAGAGESQARQDCITCWHICGLGLGVSEAGPIQSMLASMRARFG